MSAKLEEQRRAEDRAEQTRAQKEAREAGLLEDVVADGVMAGLGRPPGLQRVQSRRLWDDNYRVNVFIGPDFVSSRVAHSYFLKADDNGKILSCQPAITRLY